jgi:hypothetical protein
MSGIVIQSAYYGDEKGFANITKSLAGKIMGGVLDVTASSDLKPTFEAAPETKLSSSDERRIREAASASCGGEADQACMERTRLKLSEERLREKENEDLSKSVFKGDRLTLNIIDNGVRRKLITPAGQKLKLENVIGDTQTAVGDFITADKIQEYAIALITVVASTFFWVFGIVAPYAVFMREYEKNPVGNDIFRTAAYGTAAASVIFPGAGYVFILLFYGFSSFIKEYIAAKNVPQTVR